MWACLLKVVVESKGGGSRGLEELIVNIDRRVLTRWFASR